MAQCVRKSCCGFVKECLRREEEEEKEEERGARETRRGEERGEERIRFLCRKAFPRVALDLLRYA